MKEKNEKSGFCCFCGEIVEVSAEIVPGKKMVIVDAPLEDIIKGILRGEVNNSHGGTYDPNDKTFYHDRCYAVDRARLDAAWRRSEYVEPTEPTIGHYWLYNLISGERRQGFGNICLRRPLISAEEMAQLKKMWAKAKTEGRLWIDTYYSNKYVAPLPRCRSHLFIGDGPDPQIRHLRNQVRDLVNKCNLVDPISECAKILRVSAEGTFKKIRNRVREALNQSSDIEKFVRCIQIINGGQRIGKLLA